MDARKAAFQDEDEERKSKSNDNIDVVKVSKKSGRSRLSVVLENLEHIAKEKMIAKKKESVKIAEEALRKAMEDCFVGYDDDNSSTEEG